MDRYSGQHDKEGAFLACSCWLVEALVHVGRVQEAEQLFLRFEKHCNDLGLLTEELDPQAGQLIRNLPQALTHLAIIGAHSSLERNINASRHGWMRRSTSSRSDSAGVAGLDDELALSIASGHPRARGLWSRDRAMKSRYSTRADFAEQHGVLMPAPLRDGRSGSSTAFAALDAPGRRSSLHGSDRRPAAGSSDGNATNAVGLCTRPRGTAIGQRQITAVRGLLRQLCDPDVALAV